MKIAYLILAHANPQKLRRLVDAIQAPWADIFIHIDKKAELAPFVDACKGADVQFHEPRIKLQWGGWSIVQAQLAMLEAIRSPQYKYYKLLSGDCYPVKSREQIREHLEASEENFQPVWPGRNITSHCDPLDFYHFTDAIPIENFLRPDRFRASPLRQFLRHPIQITYWGLFYLLLYTDHLRRLKKLIPRRKRPLPVYGGDMWWCLRHEFVEYLLDFLARRPDVVRYFKYVRPPDEYMITSIVCNSGHPFQGRRIHLNHMHLRGEWRRRKMRGKNILFARKFDEQTFARLENTLGARYPGSSGPAPTGSFPGAGDAHSR